MSTAAQEAATIRKAIKAAGIDPKGMVRVRNTDYTTEIELFVYGPDRAIIEEALRTPEVEEGQYPISW